MNGLVIAPEHIEKLRQRIYDQIERIPFSGCWIWMGYVDSKQYGRMSIPTESGARVYRVSWVIHNGPLLPCECVLHRCDTPPCCNPHHLFLGDRNLNNIDKMKKGRAIKKLSAADVISIRADGRLQREIAKDYSVNRSMISQIKSGKERIYV